MPGKNISKLRTENVLTIVQSEDEEDHKRKRLHIQIQLSDK